jgi:hypothetical protein
MKIYKAKIDNGEGGSKTITARDSGQALSLAMEWAERGDWSESNNAHVSGVTVSVVNVDDSDDAEDDHFYATTEAAK